MPHSQKRFQEKWNYGGAFNNQGRFFTGVAKAFNNMEGKGGVKTAFKANGGLVLDFVNREVARTDAGIRPFMAITMRQWNRPNKDGEWDLVAPESTDVNEDADPQGNVLKCYRPTWDYIRAG